MVSARLPTLLVVLAAAAGGPLGCATMMRPSRATLTLTNAPPDLAVFDDNGAPIPLTDAGAGVKKGEMGWKTKVVTVKTGGAATPIELGTTFSLGYFLVDYLLAVVPIAIDWATGKWTNFADVNVPEALAEARQNPVRNAPTAPLISLAQPAPPARDVERRRVEAEAQREHQQREAQQAQQAQQPAPQPAQRRAVVTTGKLAVLDFKSYTNLLKPEDVRYFTDVVRGATLKHAPGMQVMTRENLLVLLQATGKDASQCEGECEVDTGRRIGADAVVSGEILKVGSNFKMSLKLHDTKEGRLLSTSVASGKSIDELDASAQAAAAELLVPKQ